MKKLVLLLIIALVSPLANANELVFGAKVELLDIDFSGVDDDPTVVGSFKLGYEFLQLGIAEIGVEGEFSTSLTDGEIAGQDYSYEAVTLAASIRTAGPVYAIGRVGLTDADIDLPNGTLSDDGTLIGIGVGFSLGVRTELEFTQIDYDDIGDAEMITVSFSF